MADRLVTVSGYLSLPQERCVAAGRHNHTKAYREQIKGVREPLCRRLRLLEGGTRDSDGARGAATLIPAEIAAPVPPPPGPSRVEWRRLAGATGDASEARRRLPPARVPEWPLPAG